MHEHGVAEGDTPPGRFLATPGSPRRQLTLTRKQYPGAVARRGGGRGKGPKRKAGQQEVRDDPEGAGEARPPNRAAGARGVRRRGKGGD